MSLVHERQKGSPVPFDFKVTLEGFVHASSDDDIVDHLDSVMAELIRLRAEDPSVDLDLENRSVGFQVVVPSTNPIEAVVIASGLIRTAIHAVGGSTPDWPGVDDRVWGIQLVNINADQVPDKVDTDDAQDGKVLVS